MPYRILVCKTCDMKVSNAVPHGPEDERCEGDDGYEMIEVFTEREVQKRIREDRARQRRTRVTTCDDDDRVPVEELLIGETVQAVKAGPKGEVIQNGNGWMVARYRNGPGGTCTYKHGHDRIFRVRG